MVEVVAHDGDGLVEELGDLAVRHVGEGLGEEVGVIAAAGLDEDLLDGGALRVACQRLEVLEVLECMDGRRTSCSSSAMAVVQVKGAVGKGGKCLGRVGGQLSLFGIAVGVDVASRAWSCQEVALTKMRCVVAAWPHPPHHTRRDWREVGR